MGTMDVSNERKKVTVDDFSKIETRYKAEKIEDLHGKRFYDFMKRFFDIVISLAAIILLCIPMLIIAIMIKCDSAGKVIYSQVRLGKNEKPFVLYKFRSMKTNAEENGIQWASENDSRTTKIGEKLRATRLDELPQLVNILKGEMSFVGPRPERPEFYDVFDTYIEGFRQRMLVKPGLTGLAQVVGGYNFLPEEKIVYDLEYIKNRSLLRDFRLIIKTVKVVFNGDEDKDSIKDVKCCEVIKEETQQ